MTQNKETETRKVKQICDNMTKDELSEVIKYAEDRRRKLIKEERAKALRDKKVRIRALPKGAPILIMVGTQGGKIGELVEARRKYADIRIDGELWEYDMRHARLVC